MPELIPEIYCKSTLTEAMVQAATSASHTCLRCGPTGKLATKGRSWQGVVFIILWPFENIVRPTHQCGACFGSGECWPRRGKPWTTIRWHPTWLDPFLADKLLRRIIVVPCFQVFQSKESPPSLFFRFLVLFAPLTPTSPKYIYIYSKTLTQQKKRR